MRLPTVGHGLHEHVDAAGLAGTAGSEGHHAVSDPLRLVQLDEFQRPRGMVDELGRLHLRLDGTLQLRIATWWMKYTTV